MAATTATILNKNLLKSVGNGAGVFNGVFSVNGNAGYIGDVCGTNGALPSISNSDYKADLDAVNLSNRINKNADKSLPQIVDEYYRNVNAGVSGISRADEFLNNISIEKIKNEREAFDAYARQKYLSIGMGRYITDKNSDEWKKYKEYTSTFDTFIKNLEDGNNDW